MEHLADRAIFFSLGCLFGLFLGYLVSLLREIKEKVNEVDEIVKNDHEHNELGFMRIPAVADTIMLILVLAVAYAAFQSQHNSNQLADQVEQNKIQTEQNQVARCKAGTENRNVQRELVEAIYGLATGSVSDNPNLDKLTPLERRQYNAYIARVNDFRSGMYKKIQPSEECVRYVDDNNVKPPTDPFPEIPPPKEPR